MPRLAITSPSATSWSPGSTADDVAGDDLVGQQLDHGAVADDLGPGRDQHRQLVQGRLRLQLLADADVGVDDGDQAEERVGVEPEPEVEHEEDADDRVEEGEDVAGDDARGRARGGLRRRPQLAQALGRLGAGEALLGGWLGGRHGVYSIGCGSDGSEAWIEPRLLGHRPGRRGRARGRHARPRSSATSRSGRPSPTAPTWSACWPGWRRRRRRSTSAPRSCRCRRARRPPRRWPGRRSTNSPAAASSSASAPPARRSPRAGTASPTRSPGAAPASTSKSCARSSPARARSNTRASITSCRCPVARASR